MLPSVIMYKMFGTMNLSKYKGVNKGMQLGGPIAAYFIIMLTIFHYTNKIDSDLVAYMDRQQEIHADYTGTWVTVSQYKDEEGVAQQGKGKAYIKHDRLGYRLIMNGVYLNEQGLTAGSWEADDVLVNRQKLVFLWSINSLDPDAGMLAGVGKLRTTYDTVGNLIEMRGNWGMIGKPTSGSMLWVRDTNVFNGGSSGN